MNKFQIKEIISLNPTEFNSSVSDKKIAMEELKNFYKYIDGFSKEKYNGATKFRNGDTLLAKITPCLENGKTAYVDILDKNEVAFGSTEYIIMRNIEGVTEKEYIYYLSISPYFRKLAISCMIGTSGRKRVDEYFLKNKEIYIHSLPEQKIVSNLLSQLDQKIRTNNKINTELEKMAKTLYDYWFVQFDFPNDAGKPYRTSGGAMTYTPTLKREIPTDWKNGTFSNMIDECVGGEWGDENAFNDSIKVNCLRGADIGELLAGNYPNCPTRHIGKNKQSKLIVDTAIVIEISGGSPSQSTGRSALITKEIIKDFDDKVVCSNFCRAIVSKTNYEYYLYGLLQSYYNNGVFFNFEGKTTGIKNLLLESFFASKIVIPSEDILTNFNKKVEILYKEKSKKIIENKQLAELRDFLLPLLMTGQVQVVERQEQAFSIENGQEQIKKDKKYFDQRFDMWLENQGLAARGAVDKTTLRAIFDAMDDEDK